MRRSIGLLAGVLVAVVAPAVVVAAPPQPQLHAQGVADMSVLPPGWVPGDALQVSFRIHARVLNGSSAVGTASFKDLNTVAGSSLKVEISCVAFGPIDDAIIVMGTVTDVVRSTPRLGETVVFGLIDGGDNSAATTSDYISVVAGDLPPWATCDDIGIAIMQPITRGEVRTNGAEGL